MQNLSFKFILGVILLATNPIFGWFGILSCVYLAKRTKKKFFYSIGILLYSLSWVILALGVVLAGPEGIILSKILFAKYGWKAITLSALIVLICLYIWEQEITILISNIFKDKNK